MKGFSMGDHAAGSYAFGTFDENQDELARFTGAKTDSGCHRINSLQNYTY